MPLDKSLSEHWRCVQGELFPWLRRPRGPKAKGTVTFLTFALVRCPLNHRR